MYNKAVHERLIEAAKTDDELVFYSEITRLAGLKHMTGDALSGALGRLFYAVIQADLAIDPSRPMLSAIAVSRDYAPGRGFYTLAREMGKLHSQDAEQEREFWIAELNALRAYWSAHRG